MKNIVSVIIIGSMFLTFPLFGVFAHGGGDEASVDEIIEQIFTQQNVEDKLSIQCGSIDEHAFEELGDAVMALRHPDPKVHEVMDGMMGGEGSESLKKGHIAMGKGYLGCIDDELIDGMMGGIGMMGTGNGFFNLNQSSFMTTIIITIWIFLILGIIWLIKSLITSKKK